MKVLVFPSWYANRTTSKLNGSFFKEQALGMQKAGIEVAIGSVDFNGRRVLLTNPETLLFRVVKKDEGLPTYRVDGVHLIYRFPELVKNVWSRMFQKLYHAYVEDYGKPDIIIAHSYWAGYASSLISSKYDVPYIVVEHVSTVLRKKLPQWHLPYLSQSYHGAKRVCAVSSKLARSMKDLVPDLALPSIVPNFVDTLFFRSPSFQERTNSFLAVGHLHQGKNFEMLMSAFLKTNAYRQGWLLKIGGNGPEMNKLVQLKGQIDTKDGVKLLNTLSREEVKQEMSTASVFVNSSNFETFSVVLIEAMSMGLPLISTDCGGPADIVNQQNGILVEINSEEGMVKALDWMASNHKKYNREELRKEADLKYGLVSVTTIYKKVISELLA